MFTNFIEGGAYEKMSEKKDSVGMQLRCLNNLIMRYMENSPVKKKMDQITGMNGWIIGYIASHPDEDIYQKDFEKRFSITRSTASKVLSLMEKKGLILRQSVPHDARLKKIVLTPKALEVHEMVKKDAAHFEGTLTEGFSKAEKALLISYLERIKNNIKKL